MISRILKSSIRFKLLVSLLSGSGLLVLVLGIFGLCERRDFLFELREFLIFRGHDRSLVAENPVDIRSRSGAAAHARDQFSLQNGALLAIRGIGALSVMLAHDQML